MKCEDKTQHEPHMRESILHAVVNVEQAVVHAVRDEVDLLFNDSDHRTVSMVSNTSRSRNKRNSRSRKTAINTKDSDRNRFGWGLDQSSGF